MKPETVYTIKVWLTAVVIAPIIISGVDFIANKYADDDYLYLIAAIIIGCFMSFPSYGLLNLTVRLTMRYWNIDSISMKAFWSIASLVYAALPFIVIGIGKEIFEKEVLIVILAYYMVIVAGIWFYRLESESDKGNEME